VVAITLGVLVYTLYAGCYHVDSDRIAYVPDRVEGVHESVQKLVAPA
jgi:hypothetical protein